MCKIRMAAQESSCLLDEYWKTLAHFRSEHRRRAQREKADGRSDFQPCGPAVGQPQHIVEESVFLVPQLVVPVADAIHRRGNPEEMLDELVRKMVAALVVHRQ